MVWCEGRGYKYVEDYKAHVKRPDLEVRFARRYEDARDAMCDALNPYWKPVDDFAIIIRKLYEGEEVEDVDPVEIETKDKRVANWVWYLAKKMGCTFEQFNELECFGAFKGLDALMGALKAFYSFDPEEGYEEPEEEYQRMGVDYSPSNPWDAPGCKMSDFI